MFFSNFLNLMTLPSKAFTALLEVSLKPRCVIQLRIKQSAFYTTIIWIFSLDEIRNFVKIDGALLFGASQQVSNYSEGYIFKKNRWNAAQIRCTSPYLNIPKNMEI